MKLLSLLLFLCVAQCVADLIAFTMTTEDGVSFKLLHMERVENPKKNVPPAGKKTTKTDEFILNKYGFGMIIALLTANTLHLLYIALRDIFSNDIKEDEEPKPTRKGGVLGDLVDVRIGNDTFLMCKITEPNERETQWYCHPDHCNCHLNNIEDDSDTDEEYFTEEEEQVDDGFSTEDTDGESSDDVDV